VRLDADGWLGGFELAAPDDLVDPPGWVAVTV
jgi:hypothetical protein